MDTEIESCITIYRIEIILISTVLILLLILNIFVSITGATGKWYNELKHGSISQWIVIFFWIIATLLSYISLILLWNYIDVEKILIIMVFFLIGNFLLLGWVSIFYCSEDIGLSVWLVGLLFVYNFWLFIYIWYIRPIAAIFIIPITLFYIFLMYSVAHLAYLNDIVL